jgi:RNA polymerase sigma-70 factor (ECF subfamily)
VIIRSDPLARAQRKLQYGNHTATEMIPQAVTTTIAEVPDNTPAAEQLAEWLGSVATDRDRRCFEHLFGHFAPRLKSYMMRLGADAVTAEDLAQETMIKVWHKASLYDRSKAGASVWIFRIARNLRIDKLRRQRFHEVELDTEEIARQGHYQESNLHADRLDADRLPELVQELPIEQLEVVRLAFFEGLTHSEICQKLELPLGTVKSRLRLAFAKLRNAMGENR